MKYITNIFILLSIALLTACNKDDKEPELTPLPIHRQFKPEILHVKLSELDKFTDYKDRLYIINSAEEIPEDKYFNSEIFQQANINFSDYSLIIAYQLLLGDIATFKYNWSYNNWEERYQINTIYDRIKGSEYADDNIENFSYIRSAILVRHISADSELAIVSSIYER